MSLIGQICMDRRIEKEVVRSTMMKVWRVGKPVVFKEIRPNIYVITFANTRD